MLKNIYLPGKLISSAGIVIISILAIPIESRSQDYVSHYNQSREEYTAGNYANYLRELKIADSLRPNHQIIMYRLAGANSLNKNKGEAIAYLSKALLIKADFEFEEDPDFVNIKDSDDFKALISLKEQLLKPVLNSTQAFEYNEPNTHIESITFNSNDQSFYLGSINKRKVIKYNKEGNFSTFKKEGEDGLMAVFGMSVDQTNNYLYVATSAIPEMENYSEEDNGKAAIFKYDLSSGQLQNKFELTEGEHLLGDVTQVGNRIFATDSKSNQIYELKDDKLEPWVDDSRFLSLQGICGSEDKKDLFISDYVLGLFKINIETKEIIELTSEKNDFSLKGIDGLYFINNSLIAIHNGVIPNRVSQYSIEGDKIVSHKILDKNHPDFGEPTLGSMTDNGFYYVANSQWPLYKDNVFNNEGIKVKVLKVEVK